MVGETETGRPASSSSAGEKRTTGFRSVGGKVRLFRETRDEDEKEE